MENAKNHVLVVGLLTLILGLVIGYFVATTAHRPLEVMGGNDPQAKNADASVDMHSAMREMTSGLSGKTGDELDLVFLDEMIIHHEGAIEMAHTLLKETKRPELIKLGNDIITAQTREIEMMNEWRKAWFNQ